MEDEKFLDQPATKRELKEVKGEIKDMKESLDFIVQNAATKEDLRRTKDELREEMLDYKSDTINHVDAVLKQVVAIREEQIMKTGRDDNQDEEIGKVKNRVTNVEYHIGIEPLAA